MVRAKSKNIYWLPHAADPIEKRKNQDVCMNVRAKMEYLLKEGGTFEQKVTGREANGSKRKRKGSKSWIQTQAKIDLEKYGKQNKNEHC